MNPFICSKILKRNIVLVYNITTCPSAPAPPYTPIDPPIGCMLSPSPPDIKSMPNSPKYPPEPPVVTPNFSVSSIPII